MLDTRLLYCACALINFSILFYYQKWLNEVGTSSYFLNMLLDVIKHEKYRKDTIVVSSVSFVNIGNSHKNDILLSSFSVDFTILGRLPVTNPLWVCVMAFSRDKKILPSFVTFLCKER